MNTTLVSAIYLFWLYDYARDQGIHPVSNFGMLPDKLERPYYSIGEWRTLFNRAAHLLNDPDFGLNFGRTISPQRLGLVGYLLYHCDDLGQAYLRTQQYQRLLTHLRCNHITRCGNICTYGWHLGATDLTYQEEIFTLASAIQFARMLTGQTITLNSISMISGRPENHDALDAFFNCPIQFNQRLTSVTHERSMLRTPNMHSNVALRNIMEEQANLLLKALPPEDDLLQRVRHVIMALLPQGEPSLERVSSTVNMSSRTLHRRLMERGVRFRTLLDLSRKEQAIAYLRDEKLSLAQVALLLGYSEQSPFTHAFKRWTGCTPSDWRNRMVSASTWPVL